jgi:hypothetical protein
LPRVVAVARGVEAGRVEAEESENSLVARTEAECLEERLPDLHLLSLERSDAEPREHREHLAHGGNRGCRSRQERLLFGPGGQRAEEAGRIGVETER